jgi:hypothetical protein
MIRSSYPQRQQNPPVLESTEIVVALILMAVCWFAWYVARERFYLAERQIAEDGCLLDSSNHNILWQKASPGALSCFRGRPT